MIPVIIQVFKRLANITERLIKNRKISNGILILCLLVFAYSSYKIIHSTYDNYMSRKLNEELQEKYYRHLYKDELFKEIHYSQEADFHSLLNKLVLNITNIDPVTGEVRDINPKFKVLLDINEDVLGWIKIPNTAIDYPVLKSDNNEYYLERTINHERRSAGSIFMDYRNAGDGTDKNTILYGHNMKDRTMFNNLDKYRNKDFFNNNKIIQFDILYEDKKWEIFSAYVTDIYFNYIKTRFDTPNEYMEFLNIIKKKSMFPTEVELTEDDKILTLSTCTYVYNDARFVVHARLID